MFNKIRNIHVIGNKLISLTFYNPAPDNIVDVFKSLLISDWYDPMFSNYEKMAKSTTFSAPFLCSSLPPDTKILRPGISYKVKQLTSTTI